jgi:hypothetical protein
MVSAGSHNRTEEQERQREAKRAHVAGIPGRLLLGSCVSRWKAHVSDRFSCLAEFIEHPPKTVNGTKDPYEPAGGPLDSAGVHFSDFRTLTHDLNPFRQR